jgi:beta-lactamase superfamily II metal-dependent hydrolase
LQNVNAEFAVIPVGKNSYGHPTPEVLQRLEKFGIKVLRTDINGTIEFVSDGNNITIN